MAGTRAGIKEIAEATGVSKATVSQVLGNGKRYVRPETRERVVRMAEQIGYRPNAIARGLAVRRMNTLGVLIHHDEIDPTNPALTAILDGILTVATRCRQQINIATYNSWADAEASIATLTDGRCDGFVVVVPPSGTTLVEGLIKGGIPFVLVGTREDRPTVSYVDIDNVGAARMIVSFLIDNGHRRIGFLSHIIGSHQFVAERLEGYRRALQAAGITYDPSIVITEAAVPDATRRLISPQTNDPPTAIFCVTDSCALLLMRQLTQHGLRIPQDISVAGFDDIPYSALSHPPLTTMRQPSNEAGQRAAQILLGLIEGTMTAGTKVVLETEIAIRESVGQLPGA